MLIRKFLAKIPTVLLAAMLSTGTLGVPHGNADETVSEELLRRVVDAVHEEIWRRFVDQRHGTLLHYAGKNGEFIQHTAEECRLAKPNGMGWSTPIEDGPFFGGLYLDALCQRWASSQAPLAKERARKIANGLVVLASVSDTPGFIARGLADDGKSHFPCSSEDQTFPWLYGLWRYCKSDIPTDAERTVIVRKMSAVVAALEKNQWRIPCDPPAYGDRGAFGRPTAADAPRLLFTLRAMHDLTGESRWLDLYRSMMREEVGKTPRSRLQLCAAGIDYGPAQKKDTYLWTSSRVQAALRGLVELEGDEDVESNFQAGLVRSAENAAVHLARARAYDKANDLTFDVNWRFLNPSWKPQASSEESIALGREQLPLFARHNPRGPYEDDCVREPLFAAWIITLSHDPAVLSPRRQQIEALLVGYDWSTLYNSYFFVAENIYFELGRNR